MDFTEAWNDTCSRVGLAARTGNFKLLRKLIRQGLPVDVEDNRGWKPLHEAAALNHANCVELLLSNRLSDVNCRTYEGHSALLLACHKGHKETVRVLLKAGADPNCCDGDITALTAAVSCRSIECVEMLVEQKANVNLNNLDHWSSLHEAAQHGSTEFITYLLDHGADITAEDDNGRIALFVAAEYGQLPALELLYKRSNVADINDIKAADATTLLMIASQGGHVDCVQFLIDNNSKVDTCTKDGITAVHLAAHKGNIGVLKVLLQHSSAETTESSTVARFGTPLHVAAAANRSDVVAYLISNGFRTDLTESFEFDNTMQDVTLPTRLTPLGEAARCGAVKSVKAFLDAGVNPNVIPDNTLAPLSAAFVGENKAVIKLLLESGSFVNYQGSCCRHPEALLMGAKTSCFELLLKAGGNVSSLLSQEPAKVVEWLTPVKSNNRRDLSAVKNKLDVLGNYVTNCSSVVDRLAADPQLSTVSGHLRKSDVCSLTHLSRLVIRQLLISSGRPNFLQCVKQLPIPPCLQDYLVYNFYDM